MQDLQVNPPPRSVVKNQSPGPRKKGGIAVVLALLLASGGIVVWLASQRSANNSEGAASESTLPLETFVINLTNANLNGAPATGSSQRAYLRIVFECGLVSAEHLTFREFLASVPEKTYIASCDLSPVGATAVLQLDLDIAFPIVDIMLGGEGTPTETARDLTEIEEQVLEGIIRIVFRELQNSWNAIALEFNFGARQQMLQTQRLMPPEEKNLCLSFEIKMSETRGTLNLAVPAVVSNALLRTISADFSYQRRRIPAEARIHMQKKLLNCFFPVELSMPGLQVPLEALTNLEAGSVLPFSKNASDPAVLLVDDVYLGAAFPVRLNARRAARVLSVETPLAAGVGL
jgi:flagellar motor switch protein FliM